MTERAQFNPDGDGYDEVLGRELAERNPLTIPKPTEHKKDYVTQEGAFQAWVWHPELDDYKKHSGSFDSRTGMMLKGMNHKSINLTLREEERLGNEVYKHTDGRYYTRKAKAKGGGIQTIADLKKIDDEIDVTAMNKNIRRFMKSGKTAKDVVEAFNFPPSVENPSAMVAAVAIAEELGTSLEESLRIYPMIKDIRYPNMTDEELVQELFTSEGLPKSTMDEQYYKEKAKEDKAKAEEYAGERTKVESEIDWTEHEQSVLESDKHYLEVSKVKVLEKARKVLDDDWFGKGNQHQKYVQAYFDQLFNAETPAEEAEAERKYVHNLQIHQQYKKNELDRYEHQLRYNTADETQLERWRLAARQGVHNAKGTLAHLAEKAMHLNKALSITDRSRAVYQREAGVYKQIRLEQAALAERPELWRQELDWIDGGTGAVLRNAPTAVMAIGAAVIGAAVAGPTGAKVGVGLLMGAAETGSMYGDLMEQGFTEKEANLRVNIAYTIIAGINAASGGILKWTPQIKKTIFGKVTQKGVTFGWNATKELLEEVGEEITTMVLSNNAPYNEDGTFDYASATNMFLKLARDTMFMSTAYFGTSKGAEYMAKKFKTGVLAQEDYDDIARIEAYLLGDDDADAKADDDLNTTSKEPSISFAKKVKSQGRFYVKDTGGGKYQIWDSDTDQQYSKSGEPRTKKTGPVNYTYDEAVEITNIANGYQEKTNPSNDPMVRLNRYVQAQLGNKVDNPIYKHIAKMLNPSSKHDARIVASHELASYVTELRDLVALHMGEERAGVHIPDELIKNINNLSNMWKKTREVLRQGQPHLGFISKQSKFNIANTLQGIVRLHQMYGDTAENEVRRNFINSWIHDIVKNKHQKEILSEEQAKTNVFVWLWDMTLGTSKDDHLTTLIKTFGHKGTLLGMKNIRARELSNKIFEDLTIQMMEIQATLDITKEELHDWSTPLKRTLVKPTQIAVRLGNEPHTITMGQLMWLNLAIRDDVDLELLQTVGVAFPNLDMSSLEDSEITALKAELAKNPKALAYVDALQDFYIAERGEIMNIGSQDMLGYDLVSDGHFLPLSRKGENGQGAIMIMDVFTQTTEDIRLAAHYAGIKPTTDMMLDLVNDIEYVKAMQRKGKSRQLKRYRQEMSAMSKTKHATGEDLTKLITRIGAKRARSILANGRIAMLQAGSFQLYMNETDWRYMIGATIPKNILMEWDMYRQRAEGMGGVSSVVSTNTVRKMHLGRGSVLDYTMWPLHKVDLKIIKQAGNIAYREMIASNLTGKARRWWMMMEIKPSELKQGSPEFMQALHERASYLAATTQPMFFPESRNLYSNSNSAMMRELSRFRSFTDQLLRNQARKIALWRMGEISTREMAMNVGTNMVFATTWYNGLKWIISEMFRDEDDESRDLLLDIMLGPVSNIPFIGWSLTTGIRNLAEDSGYGPAAISTISAEQIHHTMNTASQFAKAIKMELSGKPGSRKKAEKLYMKASKNAVEDMLVLGFGLPTWLAKVIPTPEPVKAKGTKKGSAYSIY